MAHSHSITENPTQMIGLAALAAGIGALVALLFTPRTGQQVRNGVKRRVDHAAHDVKHRIDEKRTRNQAISERLKEAVDNTKSDMSQTASNLSDNAKQATRDVKASADKAKDEASDVADHVRRNGEP